MLHGLCRNSKCIYRYHFNKTGQSWLAMGGAEIINLADEPSNVMTTYYDFVCVYRIHKGFYCNLGDCLIVLAPFTLPVNMTC